MLEGRGLSVKYADKTILDGVSLTIDKGDLIALGGASGSGKTTLLRILAGLDRPQSGAVLIDGSDMCNGTAATPWPRVTFVFQDIRLFPNLTGIENCAVGLRRSSIGDEIEMWSRELGVSACLPRMPEALSQGERQRIAITRAIVRHPKYLLLDEPTSALDSVSKERVKRVLRTCSIMKGMAIVFISHDIELISSIATKRYQLSNGSLIS